MSKSYCTAAMFESHHLVTRTYAESPSSNLYQWSSFYVVCTTLQTALLGIFGLFNWTENEASPSSEQLASLWLIQILFLVVP